jgi:hypothetical protein
VASTEFDEHHEAKDLNKIEDDEDGAIAMALGSGVACVGAGDRIAEEVFEIQLEGVSLPLLIVLVIE